MSVTGATRWLEVSGQVGIDPDGTPAGDSAAQMKRCFQNIIAVLQDAGMVVGNLVKITAFITSADDVALFRSVRDEMLAGHVCASTLLVVSALANPAWSVEIEAVAAA
jgi:enamine deaminase RidA (YjgF/YER057c/UK114 family)